MTEHQERKQVMRQFMREHYTDERLAMLLAHAQSGKLSWCSCCCFVGASNADHALRGKMPGLGNIPVTLMPTHVKEMFLGSNNAREANWAFLDTGGPDRDDKRRRRILIPMIRAEMKRREMLHIVEEQSETARERAKAA